MIVTMSHGRLIFGLLTGVFVFAASATAQPSSTVAYKSIQGQSYNLYPWFGQKIVVLTRSNALDPSVMSKIVSALDAAFGIYEDVTGTDPSPYAPTTLNGRDTIAEVPDGATCGAGCTYIGANGSEVTSTFFSILYDGVRVRGEYDHLMFYEFGRSFWSYGNQLGKVDTFVNGFAIGNRFISMDRIPVKGGPFNNSLIYAEFERTILVDLLNAYLADPTLTWRKTLLSGAAPPNPYGWGAADLAASMFYRIYADYGFDSYKAFWRALAKRPTAATVDDTVRNFLAAANGATGRDYGFLFKDSFDAPPVDLCTFAANPSSLSVALEGGALSFDFTTGREYCPWSVSVGSASWAHLTSPAKGSGSGRVMLTVDLNMTGQPRVTSIIVGKASVSLTQTFAPSRPPSIARIANGADFSNAVAPGSWIAIGGQNLALMTLQASTIHLPLALAGVRVLANGGPIPVYYVSPAQINAQLPYDASGMVNIVVENLGVVSQGFVLSVAAAAPGFFVSNGRAIAQNVDALTGTVTLNGPANPVRAGDYLVFYLTGQGLLDMRIPAGEPAPLSPLIRPLAPVGLTLNAEPVEVLFAGMTPGLIAVLQVNVRVPDGIGHGDIRVVCTIGGSSSQPAVVSVQ